MSRQRSVRETKDGGTLIDHGDRLLDVRTVSWEPDEAEGISSSGGWIDLWLWSAKSGRRHFRIEGPDELEAFFMAIDAARKLVRS